MRSVLGLVSIALLAAVAQAQADRAVAGKGYVLGPEDVVSIRAFEVEEIGDKPFQIDTDGMLHVPVAGRVAAAGLTIHELEQELASRLKVYVKKPEVTVTVAEYRSQPVSVLGAVQKPGVQQVQGRKNLAEVLSMAGGLRDDAGYSVRITRLMRWGAIPLPNASSDPKNEFSMADVSVELLLEGRSPAENITVMPNDVITVPRGEMIYVQGQVHRPGAFLLREREQMSILTALSLAEGLERTASPKSAKILRMVPGGDTRSEMSVDLTRILEGRKPDIMMRAGDILFLPNNVTKNVTLRTIESAIQIGTGLVIFRR